MKPKVRTNIIIALLVVAFCIFISLVMLFRIGKFTFAKTNEVRVVFNFVNGLDAGAPVRYGGALVGKVDRVEVLTGVEREKLGQGRCILVVVALNKPVDLTENTEVTVNTMGFIGEKYIEMRPGPYGSAPLKGNLLVGDDPAQMEKLISSGQKLIDELQVTAVNLNQITKELDERLPGLTDKMDHAFSSADRALGTLGSQEAQRQIKDSLANLQVITAYGKVFTTTVAEKPWRLIWGGKVHPLPPESEILGKPAGDAEPVVAAEPAPEAKPVVKKKVAPKKKVKITQPAASLADPAPPVVIAVAAVPQGMPFSGKGSQ